MEPRASAAPPVRRVPQDLRDYEDCLALWARWASRDQPGCRVSPDPRGQLGSKAKRASQEARVLRAKRAQKVFRARLDLRARPGLRVRLALKARRDRRLSLSFTLSCRRTMRRRLRLVLRSCFRRTALRRAVLSGSIRASSCYPVRARIAWISR